MHRRDHTTTHIHKHFQSIHEGVCQHSLLCKQTHTVLQNFCLSDLCTWPTGLLYSLFRLSLSHVDLIPECLSFCRLHKHSLLPITSSCVTGCLFELLKYEHNYRQLEKLNSKQDLNAFITHLKSSIQYDDYKHPQRTMTHPP